MDILIEVFKWITIVLTCLTLPVTVWIVFVSLFGFKNIKDFKKVEDKQYNFAVIICARNEEPVISQLIESILKQTYKNFKCFVIADNCTDNTAMVARQAGAVVYERFSETQKGKGYALKYGLKLINKEYNEEFDAICIFDADNLAQDTFLEEMNSALCSGIDVGIGYRDTKNIYDNWLSQCYSIYWLVFLRFYHMSRYNLKLPSAAGGTGFAFKMDALENKDWNTKTLSEDVEFSIQCILRDKHVAPVRKAVFYDEQPTSTSISYKQRLRWIVGHFQCLRYYSGTIIKSVLKGHFAMLDVFLVLFTVVVSGFSLLLNITSVICMPFILGIPEYMWLFAVGVVAMNFGFWLFAAVATLLLEKKPLKKRIKGILLFPIFMISTMFIVIRAFFNPHTEWAPITHVSGQTIDDMKK